VNYPAYPDYTPTRWPEVGSIPSVWETRRLKFAATCNDEALPETTDPDYEIAYVDISSVNLINGITAVENHGFEEAPSRARRIVRDGDTIVSTVRTYLKAIAPIESPPDNMIVSTGFAVIRPLELVDSRFLGYALQNTAFIDKVVAHSTGVSYPAINPTTLICLPVSYPEDKKEQQQIAAFLDWKTGQIDALIAKKKELLKKLKEKRLAVITQAVTKGLNPAAPLRDSGITWLGQVPEHWSLNYKLGFLAASEKNSFVNGPFGSDLLTTELVDEGIPVLYSGDVKATRFNRKSGKYVTEEKALELNFCRVDAGDVLLAKVGDPPGDACVYPLDSVSAIITQDVVRIRVDRTAIDSDFLSFLLVSEMGRYLVKLVSVEATRGRFSLADLKSVRLPIPPLVEQKTIAKHLSSILVRIDKMSEANELAIDRLTEYRTALITAATTGKIDVRNVAVPIREH